MRDLRLPPDQDFVDLIFRAVACNYERGDAAVNRNRSQQNWRWQFQTQICADKRSREVVLERAIAAAGGRTGREDWANQAGRGEVFHAHVISYADDFVILSRGHAEEALTWTRAVMTKLGLTLNEAKTSVKNARREGFDFLGYTLGPRHLPNGGRWYLGASPSKKSVQRVKVKIGELLVPGNKGAWDEVRARLNRVLRGWSAYFSYGALASAYEVGDQHGYDRTWHTSSVNDTKCRGVGRTSSPENMSTGNWPSDAFDASAVGRRRGPCGEASRKAGCGKSARPV